MDKTLQLLTKAEGILKPIIFEALIGALTTDTIVLMRVTY